MKFKAEIDVMPLPNLVDPQGNAVRNTLHNIGYKQVNDVRIGKHITLTFEAENERQAKELVEEICEKVLINPIVNYYKYQVIPVKVETDENK